MKNFLKDWKYPLLLLSGVGIANLGAWIYLIALNVLVYHMGGSALAVATLYVIKPLATLFTNAWSGSMIDRLNKRKLMIHLDIYRALFIAILPLLPSLWIVYVFVFFISMASAIYEPTAMTYMTKLIPVEQRQRFNSLRSLIGSGASLIGPAIAGVLLIASTPDFAIYINAIAFLLSGFITLLLPNLDKKKDSDTTSNTLSLTVLKKDWITVINFSRKHVYVVCVYFLFQSMFVLATATDSLELSFAKEVLLLTDSEYGFLVSIAGAGFILGAITNTILSKKLAPSLLIGIGSLFIAIGYLIYAFSNVFLIAAIGFFILSFSMAYANTGFYTFYQNNIPVHMMGRIGSIYGLVIAIVTIFITILSGVATQFISIQLVVIVGSLIMLFITIVLCVFTLFPSQSKLYSTESIK
ncbi:TPA: MFS transporter [Bacillus thuringiensis]|uniref:MFS transporter n=5 Tax=Bacillus cereus group TaxID=86661 RepID=A0A9X6KWB0_BACTU|nr:MULTISPECIES: MFS transporter [Bacillus cereus group]AGE78922.1 Permease [Bacillus thuringiensis serovar kurstaki str. HD73]AHZ51942.1 macrolide-efflux protein [Bacillus thuringiensis serovar kurstaki str. YBT-1520]AIE34357.1 macrolide-efflux protein [Bacillus thuringiensis serovar kurstaki str. HD-1]AIM31300.1 permease [Bacillus thuringiensis serovar kurstaki str. YBT-1520]AJA20001.1 permease [Bacillus thuringiensis serovar galleriae]